MYPEFVRNIRDVIELCVDRSDCSMVLSVDEQALNAGTWTRAGVLLPANKLHPTFVP